MQTLLDTYKNTGTIHHAYIIEGEKEIIVSDIKTFLEENLKISTKGNPDFLYYSFDTFGIDEVRNIKHLHSQKTLSSERKIFVVTSSVITIEAQNALLKILEEPLLNTHFFIILPDIKNLAQTLISRVVILRGARQKIPDDIKNFLNSSISSRLECVRKISQEKDRDSALLLLDIVEESLFSHIKKNVEKLEEYTFIFNEISNCREYLRGRSPSIKLILEHISLILPTSLDDIKSKQSAIQ